MDIDVVDKLKADLDEKEAKMEDSLERYLESVRIYKSCYEDLIEHLAGLFWPSFDDLLNVVDGDNNLARRVTIEIAERKNAAT